VKYGVGEVAERHHGRKLQLQKGKVAEIYACPDPEGHGLRHLNAIEIKQVRGGTAFAMTGLAVDIGYDSGFVFHALSDFI
jgi:hypothetical protein